MTLDLILSRLLDDDSLAPLLRSLAGLSVAFGLGGIVGLERQWRQLSAGLRTTVLVSVGAAAFADLGRRLAGTEGVLRLVP